MEEENITVIEENIEENIEEVVPETVPEVVEVPKKKRTQSQKQIDAFVKAREKRAENVLLRKSQSEEAKELLKSERRKSKKTLQLEQAIKSTVTVLDEEQVISIINSQKQKRNNVKQSKIDEFEAARKLLGLDEESSSPKKPDRLDERFDNRRDDRYDDRYEDRYARRPRYDHRLHYGNPSRSQEPKPIQDEVISIINSQKQKRNSMKQNKQDEYEAARKLLGLEEPIPVKVKTPAKPRAPRKPRVPKTKAKPFEEPTDPSPKNPQELEKFLNPNDQLIQENPYSDW